ncbi:MAG: hypothetical protein GWO11_07710 [Desulfuromonadales bacterium]|nr:hypothetical protein [Desulfuromonadales bacterium]NIR34202.1 hypothetical protein [Desulfuromonadales bacterium]NIS41650.1 hypothetical protein [Desulfuromonadales bacterium]
MRWIIVSACLLMTACSGSFFRVPQDEYRQRVQTLGVVPVLVDADSNIVHPERAELIALLRRHNEGRHERLVETLRREKGYFDVRPVSFSKPSDRQRLLDRSQRVKAGKRSYRSYSFDPQTLAELSRREVVDALLVTVMHGDQRRLKRWERNAGLTYLETDYNVIAVTAAVVTPEGEVLWEFPGMLEGPFLHLQYPDFDEAHYNRRDEVRVRDITVEGLDRALSAPEKKLLGKGDFPVRYRALFDEIAASLDPDLAGKGDGK